MALKADRVILDDDISYFSDDTSAERGVVMVHDTGGSGAAMDQAVANVVVPTGVSGSGLVAAGVLLNDIVNKDLTQTHLNQHKLEEQTGGKVWLLKKGTIVTDQVKSGDTPTVGLKAYFTQNGQFTVTDQGDANFIGRFKGSMDADGFVKIDINIP